MEVGEQPRRVVVLGSNAFSGAAFVAEALGRGAAVLGVSRSPEADAAYLRYRAGAGAADGGAFTFLRADLNDDLGQVLEAIEAFAPEVVVNFAAQGMVAESWRWPLDWYRTNVLALVGLVEGLRERLSLHRFVQVSTPEVYGHCRGEVGEGAGQAFRPSTPYATSRAAADFHLANLHRHWGFPVVTTRSANVYGAGQRIYRIVPRAALAARLGRRLPLHGGGRSVRSFVHVGDVAAATWEAAVRGEPGGTYHFATGRYVSVRELVELVCARAGVDFGAVVELADERPGKDGAYLLGTEQARRDLGWEPRVSLEEGIDETLGWVDRNLDFLRAEEEDYVHRP